MSDLNPLGSEKLSGQDKINRIIEIANFSNNIKKEKSLTESINTLSDGKVYGIQKEKLGYIIKVAVNENEQFEYRNIK